MPPNEPHAAFTEQKAVAAYADGPARIVPGWSDMLRMSDVLLGERIACGASVLVVGAGGGLELKRFAESYPDWRFVGVDPSREMLTLARTTLGDLGSRVELHEGYIDTAPEGPFDAATCLLTLHFVPADQRLRTLQEIRRRLVPGAPFVVAHLSFPQEQDARERWLGRYAAFVATSGVDVEKARAGAKAIESKLTILSPTQEESLMREAGFSDIELFYAGFAFRGWVSTA